MTRKRGKSLTPSSHPDATQTKGNGLTSGKSRPIAAQCPNCGHPLSETSVLALAPVCEHCRTVVTGVGGTLGLTSAYGVNDPTITRKRIEADLGVFSECLSKYTGMREACKEQLNWEVGRYAKLPPPPEYLSLVNVPSFWEGLCEGLPRGCYGLFVGPFLYYLVSDMMPGDWFVLFFDTLIKLFTLQWGLVQSKPMFTWMLLSFLAPIAFYIFPHFMAKYKNGNRPMENSRRKREYEMIRARALKGAEPVKAAQDHRLRTQIRELDGLIEMVSSKKREINTILDPQG